MAKIEIFPPAATGKAVLLQIHAVLEYRNPTNRELALFVEMAKIGVPAAGGNRENSVSASSR